MNSNKNNYTVKIANCKFEEIIGNEGGAIYIKDYQGLIFGNNFSKNYAYKSGGSIYYDGLGSKSKY